jgi:hypothetical protein
MNQRLALFLSVVLHPAIVPSYIVAVIFFFATALTPYDLQARLSLLGLVFLATFAVPAAGLLLSYRSGLVASLHLHERQARVGPFLLITAYYTVASFFFLYRLPSLLYVPNILTAITFTITLVTLITFFFKISAHASGVGGMLGIFMAVQYLHPEAGLFYPILATILLLGALMSARLALRAHTPAELVAGAALGFVTCAGVFWAWE